MADGGKDRLLCDIELFTGYLTITAGVGGVVALEIESLTVREELDDCQGVSEC